MVVCPVDEHQPNLDAFWWLKDGDSHGSPDAVFFLGG